MNIKDKLIEIFKKEINYIEGKEEWEEKEETVVKLTYEPFTYNLFKYMIKHKNRLGEKNPIKIGSYLAEYDNGIVSILVNCEKWGGFRNWYLCGILLSDSNIIIYEDGINFTKRSAAESCVDIDDKELHRNMHELVCLMKEYNKRYKEEEETKFYQDSCLLIFNYNKNTEFWERG